MKRSTTAHQTPMDRAVDQAIQWTVRLGFNAPTPHTETAFQAWHEADPVNRQAWARVQAMNAALAPPPASASAASQALRRTATSRQTRRRFLTWLVASGAAGTVGWQATHQLPWQNLIADASTAVGEQRLWQLADGSSVMLNTDTAVSWRPGTDERVLTLHRGEIMIATGADPGAPRARPFRVATRDGRLTALGTRFNVRLRADDTVLMVEQGAVELRPAASSEKAVVLAGDAWRMSRDTFGQLVHDDPMRQSSTWIDGVIEARNMRLADLLQELSRYRMGRIDCHPSVADLRVSGFYQVGDTTQTLRFLAQHHHLVLSTYTKWWVRLGPAET